MTVNVSLRAQGFVEHWAPRLVTAADTSIADVVVNIGCERTTMSRSATGRRWLAGTT